MDISLFGCRWSNQRQTAERKEVKKDGHVVQQGSWPAVEAETAEVAG